MAKVITTGRSQIKVIFQVIVSVAPVSGQWWLIIGAWCLGRKFVSIKLFESCSRVGRSETLVNSFWKSSVSAKICYNKPQNKSWGVIHVDNGLYGDVMVWKRISTLTGGFPFQRANNAELWYCVVVSLNRPLNGDIVLYNMYHYTQNMWLIQYKDAILPV